MSRRTQPYRRGLSRLVGPALTNMRRGRDVYGRNPQDVARGLAKLFGRRR
jgi:hypothetical protein